MKLNPDVGSLLSKTMQRKHHWSTSENSDTLKHTPSRPELHRTREFRQQASCDVVLYLEAEVSELQEVNVWESFVPTIADSKLQSSRTCRAGMIRLIMECHEDAVPSHATQLTATLVGVAMSTLAGEHNPGSVPTLSHSHAHDDAGQPFQVEGREDAAKQIQLISSRTQLAHTRLCDMRDKESTTLRTMQNEI